MVNHRGELNFRNSQVKEAVLRRYRFRTRVFTSLTTLCRCTPQLQCEMSCIIADVLSKENFDEMVAHKLPWQLETIIDHPHCPDSIAYQQQLADILLDLRNFTIFYENDSLRCDLIRYPLSLHYFNNP